MLPEWITELDGKANTFVVDPDIAYPALLADLGVSTPDRWWLEIAIGCMKFDFDMHVRLSGKVVPGRSITRLVRSDDGRKERWNLTMHPPGERDFNALGLRERSRIIRENYRRIRGFVPAG